MRICRMLKFVIVTSSFFVFITSSFIMAEDIKYERKDNSSPKKNDEMSEDLDDLNNELKPDPIPEEKDILSLLKQIQEKMIDSADSISKISIWKAIEDGNTVKIKIDELMKRQKEALEVLNSSLQQTKKKQSEAIDNITKLIKIARKIQQGEGQGQSDQSMRQKPENKPKGKNEPNQEDQNQNNPAKKPYEATSPPPGVGKHIGGLVEMWGNLPPKIREAIILSKPDEFTLEYKQWLERYFKILAEENK